MKEDREHTWSRSGGGHTRRPAAPGSDSSLFLERRCVLSDNHLCHPGGLYNPLTQILGPFDIICYIRLVGDTLSRITCLGSRSCSSPPLRLPKRDTAAWRTARNVPAWACCVGLGGRVSITLLLPFCLDTWCIRTHQTKGIDGVSHNGDRLASNSRRSIRAAHPAGVKSMQPPGGTSDVKVKPLRSIRQIEFQDDSWMSYTDGTSLERIPDSVNVAVDDTWLPERLSQTHLKRTQCNPSSDALCSKKQPTARLFNRSRRSRAAVAVAAPRARSAHAPPPGIPFAAVGCPVRIVNHACRLCL